MSSHAKPYTNRSVTTNHGSPVPISSLEFARAERAAHEALQAAATHVADELTEFRHRIAPKVTQGTSVYLSQLIGVLRDPSRLSRTSRP